MTTPYYLASEEPLVIDTRPPRPTFPVKPLPVIPVLVLESMDGRVQIALDGTDGWIRMPGATGLEMPPYEVISGAMPGVAGSAVLDTRVLERPVFVPIYCGGYATTAEHYSRLAQLRSLIDPASGTFKLVGRTEAGERELVVTYAGGLEGDDNPAAQGLTWSKFGLRATAHQPYALSRQDRTLEFRMSTTGTPFMGVVGGTDAPWPGSMSSGAVIGSGMTIQIGGEAPVFPTLELIGPMTSFSGALLQVVINPDGTSTTYTDPVWDVDIPAGVPGGSTMRLVTDPRSRSYRLDGSPAAGRIARGSTLRAFYPGTNTLNVSAPGGNENTRILLSWREKHRSLW